MPKNRKSLKSNSITPDDEYTDTDESEISDTWSVAATCGGRTMKVKQKTQKSDKQSENPNLDHSDKIFCHRISSYDEKSSTHKLIEL